MTTKTKDFERDLEAHRSNRDAAKAAALAAHQAFVDASKAHADAQFAVQHAAKHGTKDLVKREAALKGAHAALDAARADWQVAIANHKTLSDVHDVFKASIQTYHAETEQAGDSDA